MSRGYGRGSIVSFIVVGVLLTALVLGGLFVVKNYLGGWLGGPSADEAVEDAKQIAQEATDNDGAEEPAPADDNVDNTPEEEKKTEETEPAPAPADEPRDDASQSDATDDDDAATSNSDSDDESSQAATEDDATNDEQQLATTGYSADDDEEEKLPTTGYEMPQTGLGDTLLAAFPVVAVITAVVAYRRSNLL